MGLKVPEPVQAPVSLGPYRIVRRLGRGGMAEVWLAQAYGASGFERLVALKTLLPELQGDGELERLLINEARLGAVLAHRNLVSVEELGVENGRYFVRMEFVEGADLATLLGGAPLEAPLALAVAEEASAALAYVHAVTDEKGRPLGLVHRDVSPHNVLLSLQGAVKLGDFGIAKATQLAERTRGGLRRGKYAYMSPEQIEGRALRAASDQFALGVTLYEMLCGRRPFDGATELETMDRIRAAEPPDLRGLDEDLRALLARCLARDPAARFASTEHLVEALGEARWRRPRRSSLAVGRWVRAQLSRASYAPPEPSRAQGTRPLTE